VAELPEMARLSYRKERTGHIELFVVIVQLVNTADWL
jgi:hypothetical protein